VNAFQERDGELWCEAVRLSEIGEAVGTPCYVYSRSTIEHRYGVLSSAFAGLAARIFYSVKANHNLAVLGIVRDLGAGVDVVSLGELYRARRAGFDGPDIVFGGVGKTTAELEAALSEGVRVIVVESEGELRRLDELAGARGEQAPVAIRVNPGVEAGKHSYTQTWHYGSKFGVAWEDSADIYRLASSLRNIRSVGIHAHIGSQILSPEPYRLMLFRLGETLAELRRSGVELQYLDIGGGFGVDYVDGSEIDLKEVAAAVEVVVTEFNLTCLLEPGRWLVAPAGVLLARVLYVKKLGEQNYYVTDVGSNDFMRPSYYDAQHPIDVVARPAANDTNTVTADIVGPVCETGDFLGRGRSLPALSEGDLLAVRYAGAYGFVMSSNYNSRRRAAEVLVSGSTYDVVRRRESLEDLLALEDPPPT
jgi:diaminopimelate decarboxylase